MKALVLAVSAVVFTTALPASAGIMTLGGSYAEGCYRAAEQRNATRCVARSLRTARAALVEAFLTNCASSSTTVRTWSSLSVPRSTEWRESTVRRS